MKNKIIFTSKDNDFTGLILNKIHQYGELEINFNDSIIYFSDKRDRVDIMAKPNQIIIGVNIDFHNLTAKSKYREVSFIGNKPNMTYDHFFSKMNIIGFQRHLVSQSILRGMDVNKKENLSLGLIKNNLNIVEPVFRKSDIINFDLSAIKSCEITSSGSVVTGFTTEEFIQLAKYAGYSDSVKILNFSFEKIENLTASADIIATSIWYFLESVAMNINSGDESDIESAMVHCDDSEDYINFKKSISTGKCWCLINGDDYKLPCTKKEYEDAIKKGEISDRILESLEISKNF